MQYTSGANALVFEQYFPNGANDTALGPAQNTMNLVISSWPAFQVAQQGQPLGYLAYSGPMVGSNAVSGLCIISLCRLI